MCHFNRVVQRADCLGCKGCIQDTNLRCNGFTGHWICFINTGVDIRVAEWVHAVELVVSTAIPEVAVVEDCVDNRWRIASGYLSGVDIQAVEGRIRANNTGIKGPDGSNSGGTDREAKEVGLEDTLAANDVIRAADLRGCVVQSILELREWEVGVEFELEVDSMSIVILTIWAHGNLVAITAIGTGLVVAASTCGSIGAGLLVPEEGLAQANRCCAVLDVDIEVCWQRSGNAGQWGQWQWCIDGWNLSGCRLDGGELSCNSNS